MILGFEHFSWFLFHYMKIGWFNVLLIRLYILKKIVLFLPLGMKISKISYGLWVNMQRNNNSNKSRWSDHRRNPFKRKLMRDTNAYVEYMFQASAYSFMLNCSSTFDSLLDWLWNVYWFWLMLISHFILLFVFGIENLALGCFNIPYSLVYGNSNNILLLRIAWM